LSQALPAGMAQALMAAAKTAFRPDHRLQLATAGVLILLLAAGIWRSLATVAKPQSAL
ncbi:MFS transporter, partial [Klebsiella pneumoniae]|nr:MFS transporter [Klebsiella pneumoniae]